MRASIHLLMKIIAPTRESRIYATEQSSPLYIYLHKCFPFLQGSEFAQDAALMGENNSKKLRHEDLTQLSFPTHSFDVILSFDALEHIPDYRSAFAECARTLKPTGKMLFPCRSTQIAYATRYVPSCGRTGLSITCCRLSITTTREILRAAPAFNILAGRCWKR